jgi:hypothetical protein
MARQFDDLYRGHRFIISCGGEVFSAVRIFNDLFQPNLVWVGTGHKVNEPVLDQRFNEAKTASFWMVSMQEQMLRRVGVSWKSHEWLPLDLSALEAGVAMDWVKLHGAVIDAGPYDIPISDAPPTIQDFLNPRFHGASR